MATTPSPVVEKVTRTRTVPVSELAKENTNVLPDFWDYIESLDASQWEREEHVVYLYREDPKDSTYSSEPSFVDKFSGTIEIFPGGPIYQMNDRGIVEHAIKEKHGGKAFRLICKKGRQRIAIGKCVNGAPPKYPDANPQRYPLPNAGQPATDASVATRAIDVMANQQPDALRLAMEVLRSASDIVMRQPNLQTAQPAARDPLVEALLQKALNPPPPPPAPDPFEMFVKFKNLMGDGGMGGTSAILEKILGAAVDKIINPAPAVTGRTTLLDIGREFIPVLGTVMHEYRLSREADARITEIQRSAMAPHPAPPPMQSNPPAVLPTPPAPVPQAATTPAPAAPTMTFPQIEAHIASIVSNSQFTTDEAVDEVLAFLYNTDARLVRLLLNPPLLDPRLKPGKEGLMMLCTFEAPFRACLSNPPRLSEFLDKFIVAATEAEAVEGRLAAAAPAAAPVVTA